MRDIKKTIEQAKALRADRRLLLSEVDALIMSAKKEGGRLDVYELLISSYDFGFMVGYRMGKKKNASAKTKPDAIL